MDEKEIIKKIKNSFKSGLSRAKITRRLQKKGLKLEYIDLLIKKASKIKKVLLFSSIILILMLVSSMTGYTFFFRQEKSEVVNPLLGNARIMSSGAASQQAPQTNGNRVNINDIEITVDFISFLLN